MNEYINKIRETVRGICTIEAQFPKDDFSISLIIRNKKNISDSTIVTNDRDDENVPNLNSILDTIKALKENEESISVEYKDLPNG